MPTPSSPLPVSLRKSSHIDTETLRRPSLRAPSPSGSLASLPFRANPSISSLYASTSSLAGSIRSGSSTPTTDGGLTGTTVLSGVDGRSSSPGPGTVGSPEIRNLIQRAFAPHIAVLASPDTDDLLNSRGFTGGFLDLVKPFGENISGKVTVRDSIGASRVWDDFAVRFVGLKDGLHTTRPAASHRPSFDSRNSENTRLPMSRRDSKSVEVLRVGGNVRQVEEVVNRHLDYAELRPTSASRSKSPTEADQKLPRADLPLPAVSPFYTLYLRRLLSGLPMTPHETFSHPVACVIVASSRNRSPIEEFKQLYSSTITGNDRLPQWINNEYLRYYVLVHDEDNDDINKSISLYEQMKRHFGLHCHLLRIRSAQCLPSDDDSIRLPTCEWMTAEEELSIIQRRESLDDDQDSTPCLFESDAAAIRTFVRELVTQSIVPGMERLCAQWNEQVATRRKGISGRLLSVGKRWGFGIGRNSNAPVSAVGASNYDSLQGFYRPDTPEALMRKLGDYAFMLRDFKLAQNTFDVLRSDFEHDKAWKYYAGANEMYLVSTLLNTTNPINKRLDSIERWLEGAVHSYIHRVESPFYALRTLLLAFEAVKARKSLPVDDTTKWAARIIDEMIVGPCGTALIMERIASCYAQRPGVGAVRYGSRRRKRGFWSFLAAETWLGLGKSVQAEKNFEDAKLAYGIPLSHEAVIPDNLRWMAPVLDGISARLVVQPRMLSMSETPEISNGGDELVRVDETIEELTGHSRNRRSMIPELPQPLIEVPPLSPVRTREREVLLDEGFEPS